MRSGDQGITSSGVQEFMVHHEFRSSGVLEFRPSCIHVVFMHSAFSIQQSAFSSQAFRSSGVQEFRNSGGGGGERCRVQRWRGAEVERCRGLEV